MSTFHKGDICYSLKSVLFSVPFYVLLLLGLQELGIAELTFGGILFFGLGTVCYSLFSLKKGYHYMIYAVVLFLVSWYVS